MISILLATFLHAHTADACGNAMRHQLVQYPVVFVSVESEALEDDAIELEVFRRLEGQMRYCYQRVLTRVPTLAPMSMDIDFTTLPDGTVSSVELPETVLSDEVAGCVRSRILKMKFPESDEERTLPITIKITTTPIEG